MIQNLNINSKRSLKTVLKNITFPIFLHDILPEKLPYLKAFRNLQKVFFLGIWIVDVKNIGIKITMNDYKFKYYFWKILKTVLKNVTFPIFYAISCLKHYLIFKLLKNSKIIFLWKFQCFKYIILLLTLQWKIKNLDIPPERLKKNILKNITFLFLYAKILSKNYLTLKLWKPPKIICFLHFVRLADTILVLRSQCNIKNSYISSGRF